MNGWLILCKIMVKPLESIINSNRRQIRMTNSVPHRFLTKSSFNHKGESMGGEVWRENCG